MNGFKNWSVIPARTWRIRQADEGDGWLKIPAIPIPVGELTPQKTRKRPSSPLLPRRRKLLRRSPRLRRPLKRPRNPRPK